MGERRKPEGISKLILILVLTYLALLLLVPMGALVIGTLSNAKEAVAQLSGGPALRALSLTIGVALFCVLFNGVLGVAGALVLSRQRFFGRRLLDALVDLPLALSPVMTGLAFLLVFGRTGLLTDLPANFKIVFAWPGVLLATLFVTLPFTLRELVLVLDELGDAEEQAAATLGASGWQTFWRVTLPSLRAGLTAGTALTAARALGEFGAVLVVGGAIANRTSTATTFIHTAIEERQTPAAYGMALILVALAVSLLVLLQRQRGAS